MHSIDDLRYRHHEGPAIAMYWVDPNGVPTTIAERGGVPEVEGLGWLSGIKLRLGDFEPYVCVCGETFACWEDALGHVTDSSRDLDS